MGGKPRRAEEQDEEDAGALQRDVLRRRAVGGRTLLKRPAGGGEAGLGLENRGWLARPVPPSRGEGYQPLSKALVGSHCAQRDGLEADDVPRRGLEERQLQTCAAGSRDGAEASPASLSALIRFRNNNKIT
jgi:hypothetical protein